jgi:hypothetical protein
MTGNTKILLILSGSLLAISALWKGKDVVEEITGVDTTPPEKLAKEAGVDVDTYSLARAAYNEEGSKLGRTAVMFAIKNMAKKQGISPTRLVTRAIGKDKKPLKHDGFYAKQNAGGKYCASFKKPDKATIDLAKQVQAGTVINPVGAAVQWDNPVAQDKMFNSGVPGYTKDSKKIAADRIAAGRRLVTVNGLTTRFWA